MVYKTTDDTKIKEIQELMTPVQLMKEIPCPSDSVDFILDTRKEIQNILHGHDSRLLVVVGPCSIHDIDAAMDYARRLVVLKEKYKKTLLIVMRVYFEKPRTTVGWKGLINDPDLNGQFNVGKGLRLARTLLRDINQLGLPAGAEFLDLITPQYIADFVSWGAIGARTVESQIHRELASGLSCPVGFKNRTDGNIQMAVDAVRSSASAHRFLSVNKLGHPAIVTTEGNKDCHVILRGGLTPNYEPFFVETVCQELHHLGLPTRIMIDVSHGNSQKDYENQPKVVAHVAQQITQGEKRICGLMIESHIKAGRQDYREGQPLVYGQSITDSCISWETTEILLSHLSESVQSGRF